MTDTFDAVVIGGGPGGATAALLLARAGWSVALLERKLFPRRKVCGEYLSATNRPLLAELGIEEVFNQAAGPDVRRVGLYAGENTLLADLPNPGGPVPNWGRALARESLDTLLVQRAVEAGTTVLQPWSALGLAEDGSAYRCQAAAQQTGQQRELRAPIIIAAHGSWEPGPLPTQEPRPTAHAADLFGFKAHFQRSALPTDLMPLLAFPGGYGGMVHCDGGRVSLSCCVRRDKLGEIRRLRPGDAGTAVVEHIRGSCRGVREALADAEREGVWLSAGPIRPGIRLRTQGGIFRVGNTAGEAHPVIAEGISMAMQSAWLLTDRLIDWQRQGKRRALSVVADDYRRAWRRNFVPRLRAAAVVAQWAIRPGAVNGLLPLLRWFPSILTWGAQLSGKAHLVH
jgi:flavin-dependent dehydrogenase